MKKEEGRLASAADHEVITFMSGTNEFCLDLMSIREIEVWRPPVTLLHAPSFVYGVLKLSGAILPVIDFAARLGMPPTKPTNHHIIIVIENGYQVVGLLVEGGMSEFLTVSQDMVQLAPYATSQIAGEFLRGIVIKETRTINWVSLASIICSDENLFAA